MCMYASMYVRFFEEIEPAEAPLFKYLILANVKVAEKKGLQKNTH